MPRLNHRDRRIAYSIAPNKPVDSEDDEGYDDQAEDEEEGGAGEEYYNDERGRRADRRRDRGIRNRESNRVRAHEGGGGGRGDKRGIRDGYSNSTGISRIRSEGRDRTNNRDRSGEGEGDDDYVEDDDDISEEMPRMSINPMQVERGDHRSGERQAAQRNTTTANNNYGNRGSIIDAIDNENNDDESEVDKVFTAFSVLLVVVVSLLIYFAIVLSRSRSNGRYYLPSDRLEEDRMIPYTAYSPHGEGMVATDNKICSEIGKLVLEDGGTAMDAAISSAFCLGVVSPVSSGIGGGAFILHYNASTGEAGFIDAREFAPSNATEDMFSKDPLLSQDGGLAIAVLGEVHGLYNAWQKWGSWNAKRGCPGYHHAAAEEGGEGEREGEREGESEGEREKVDVVSQKEEHNADKDPHDAGASSCITWRRLVQPAAALAKAWVISPSLAGLLHEVENQLFSGKFPLLSELYLKNASHPISSPEEEEEEEEEEDSHKNNEKRYGKEVTRLERSADPNPLKYEGMVMKSAGDEVRQPQLAKTLTAIAEKGPSYIYEDMADVLAGEIQEAGGIVDARDIRSYRSVDRPPIQTGTLGYTYIGAPPPSSGGATVATILRFMGGYEQPMASLGSLYYHRLTEAMKHAFALRLSIGDPDFTREYTEQVVHAMVDNNSYISDLRASTSDYSVMGSLESYGGKFSGLVRYPATDSENNDNNNNNNNNNNSSSSKSTKVGPYSSERRQKSYRIQGSSLRGTSMKMSHTPFVDGDDDADIVKGLKGKEGKNEDKQRATGKELKDEHIYRSLPEDHGTSHISVVDRWGNAVAMTTTVNTYFGSKVISPSTGILFNNQMDDFSIPNVTNFFGLHPAEQNYVKPLKRPLSSMSPSILLENGPGIKSVRLVGGASGGPRIITATVQVILNYIARGMDLPTAMHSQRIHSQLLPDSVDCENKSLSFPVPEISYYSLSALSETLRGDFPTFESLPTVVINKAENAHSVKPPTSARSRIRIEVDPNELSILREKGQTPILQRGSMGVAQFIAVDPDTGMLTGVSDPRKNGAPAGI